MILGKAVPKGAGSGRGRFQWDVVGNSGIAMGGLLFLVVGLSEMVLACAALERLGNSRLPASQPWGGSQWG